IRGITVPRANGRPCASVRAWASGLHARASRPATIVRPIDARRMTRAYPGQAGRGSRRVSAGDQVLEQPQAAADQRPLEHPEDQERLEGGGAVEAGDLPGGEPTDHRVPARPLAQALVPVVHPRAAVLADRPGEADVI